MKVTHVVYKVACETSQKKKSFSDGTFCIIINTKGRLVTKNAFGIMKHAFEKLLKKIELYIIIILICLLLIVYFTTNKFGMKKVHVKELMWLIQVETTQDANRSGLH
jgi:hypothetical protein